MSPGTASLCGLNVNKSEVNHTAGRPGIRLICGRRPSFRKNRLPAYQSSHQLVVQDTMDPWIAMSSRILTWPPCRNPEGAARRSWTVSAERKNAKAALHRAILSSVERGALEPSVRASGASRSRLPWFAGMRGRPIHPPTYRAESVCQRGRQRDHADPNAAVVIAKRGLTKPLSQNSGFSEDRAGTTPSDARGRRA